MRIVLINIQMETQSKMETQFNAYIITVLREGKPLLRTTPSILLMRALIFLKKFKNSWIQTVSWITAKIKSTAPEFITDCS